MDKFQKIKQLYEDNNIDQINQIIKSNSINDNNYLLIKAAYNGYLEIIKELLLLSVPKADDRYALIWAANNGHLETVKLLLPHSDIESVINQLNENKDPYFQENIDKSIEVINDYLLNQKLNEELNGFIDNSSNKQKRKI